MSTLTGGGRSQRILVVVAPLLRVGVLLVALGCGAQPFLAVTCGHQGEVAPTGPWSGYDLACGNHPALRGVAPAGAGLLFPAQLAVTASGLLVLYAMVATLQVSTAQRRRYVSLILVALSSILLSVGTMLAREHLSRVTLQPGSAGAMVASAPPMTVVALGGYGQTLAVLWFVILVDLAWWLRAEVRRRPR